MDLRLRTRQAGRATIVEVGGEVELHSAPQLREEIHRVCGVDNPCVIVDLSGVSFIDSTGLGVLIGGLKRAREKGSLSLVCPQPKVKRVFEITGLTNVFSIWNSVDEALTHSAAGDRTAGAAADAGDQSAAPPAAVAAAPAGGGVDG